MAQINYEFPIPRFAGGLDWVDSILKDSGSIVRRPLEWHCTKSASVLPHLLALLMHESLESFEEYNNNVVRMNEISSHGKLLNELRMARDLKSFSKRISSFAGTCPEIRRFNVNINSLNAFSRGYRPPTAERSRFLADHAFSRRSSELSESQSLSFHFILLTIHPFVDANGRSARMLLAADLVRGLADVGRIFEIIFLYLRSGAQFHLAAKCLRMGSVDMLMAVHDDMKCRYFDAFNRLLISLDESFLSCDPFQIREVTRSMLEEISSAVRSGG